MTTCRTCHNPNCDGYCLVNMAGEPGNIRPEENCKDCGQERQTAAAKCSHITKLHSWHREEPGQIIPITRAPDSDWTGFYISVVAVFVLAAVFFASYYVREQQRLQDQQQQVTQRVEMFLFCYNDTTKAWDRCRQGLKNADGKMVNLVSPMVADTTELICTKDGCVIVPTHR